ncbi:UNVERIFIED_CONTAM: putative GNAT family acetyltransferase [Paenibacillus sp. PvR008]
MVMESYFCPKSNKPSDVEGIIRHATREDVQLVAQFLTGFSEDAFDISVDPVSQISAAEEVIKTGNLYLWIVKNTPVSMANIAHRSPRHARINAVYTPSTYRKKGFASAIVANLCSILESEHLVPMLYADLKNPASNQVYKNIGFIEGGKITDIQFE